MPLGISHGQDIFDVSFLALGQSFDRLEFCGATRGQITGEKRDDDKQRRNREIRRRIIWPHMEKQTCHDARETEGTGQSGHNTGYFAKIVEQSCNREC